MSAWLCEPEHISLLVFAGLPKTGLDGRLRWLADGAAGAHDRKSGLTDVMGHTMRELTYESVDAVGQMLLDGNAESCNVRYDDDGLFVFSYTRPPYAIDYAPIEILKALDSFEYQSCEIDDWYGSEAYAFCAMLRKQLIRHIAGYDTADTWMVDAYTTPASIKRLEDLRAKAETP